MDTENVSIIRRGYAAHERGDFAGVFAVLHPEIEIYQTDQLPWGGSYRGHGGAKTFFGTLAAFIESHVVPEEFIEANEQVAVVGRVWGQVRANNQAFDLRVVHLWAVSEGKAVRFEAYIDTPGMLRALAGTSDDQ